MTKRISFGAALFALLALAACGDTQSWTEDVQLFDGSVITVTEERRSEEVYAGNGSGTVTRETWLTFEIPHAGSRRTTWHEYLRPQVLNEYRGSWYVVAVPPTWTEFAQYGRPRPQYVCFVYRSGTWERIPFNSVPTAIYDTNLLIDAPPSPLKHVSLQFKEGANSDPMFPGSYKRLDPMWNPG